MANFEEKRTLVSVTYLAETGVIEVKEADKIYKDGVEISSKIHRKCISPLDDVSKEVDIVKDVADKFWTDEVKTKYAEIIKNNEGGLNG